MKAVFDAVFMLNNLLVALERRGRDAAGRPVNDASQTKGHAHRRDGNVAVRCHATTREFLCRTADLRCDRRCDQVHSPGGFFDHGELTAGKACRSRFAVFVEPEQDHPGFLVARSWTLSRFAGFAHDSFPGVATRLSETKKGARGPLCGRFKSIGEDCLSIIISIRSSFSRTAVLPLFYIGLLHRKY